MRLCLWDSSECTRTWNKQGIGRTSTVEAGTNPIRKTFPFSASAFTAISSLAQKMLLLIILSMGETTSSYWVLLVEFLLSKRQGAIGEDVFPARFPGSHTQRDPPEAAEGLINGSRAVQQCNGRKKMNFFP